MSPALKPVKEGEPDDRDFFSDDSFYETAGDADVDADADADAPPAFNPGEILNEADWQRRTISDLCRMLYFPSRISSLSY